jgi:hypothetical protein
MGIVWRAHDELLDRPVAVKEVRYNGAVGEELADLNRRTMREARAAGRLTHPNVVVVHDVIEEDGRPWIVMQLVPSRSLGQVIREEGPLPPKRVAEIGLEVLKALRSAHAMGVLHRDVKPENVLLADDGRVVLTDFGIARVETDSTMTRTGLVGTPAFMPPERLRGAPAQRESDLWALGATLYAAVEGRPPHDKGAPLPTMHAVLMDEPEPAVHAGRLAPLIERLLRKDPAERPGYDQIERMLREALEPEPAPPPARPPTSSRIPQTGDAVPRPAPDEGRAARPAAAAPPPSRPGPDGGAVVPETGLSMAAEADAPPRPKGPAAGKADRGGSAGEGARRSPAGTAKPGARSGAAASRAGAASGKAGSKAGAASRLDRSAAAAGDETGPDDPTLPKNPVARPSAAKPAATGTSERAGAEPGGGKSGGAKPAKATAAKPAEPADADTVRTQKIGSWALETLGVGGLAGSTAGADAAREQGQDEERGEKPGTAADGTGAKADGGRRLGAFATVKVETPRTRLGAFASRTGEDDDAERPDTAGDGDADAAESRAPRTAARAGGAPAGSAAETDRDEAAREDDAAPKPAKPAAKRPAKEESAGDDRPAAAAAKRPGVSSSPASPARTAETSVRPGEAGGSAAAEAEPDDDRTRRLPEWPILPDDEPSAARDAGPGDAADAAAPETGAEPSAAASGTPPAPEPKAEERDRDTAADRPAGRGTRRLSPFPAPYSRPDPRTRARMTQRPVEERPRRPRPAVPVMPASLRPVVPPAVRRRIAAALPDRVLALLANPTIRIVLIAVPVIILVAIVAALLGMRDAQNEVARRTGDPGATPAADQPAGRTGANAFAGSSGTAGQAGDGAAASASPSPRPSAKTKPAAGRRDDGIPEGWRWYTDPTGFSLALPKGWKVHRREGSRVFFRGGLRSTFLLIDQTRSPKRDARRDWLAQERATRRNFPGYKRVRITSVDYFKTAADWEWTYYSGGAKLHVINRGFVTGKRRGYAIYWSTLHKNWKKNYRYFKVFVDTFRPAK